MGEYVEAVLEVAKGVVVIADGSFYLHQLPGSGFESQSVLGELSLAHNC